MSTSNSPLYPRCFMIIVLFYKFYEKTLEEIMFLSQVLVGMQDTKLLILIEQQ